MLRACSRRRRCLVGLLSFRAPVCALRDGLGLVWVASLASLLVVACGSDSSTAPWSPEGSSERDAHAPWWSGADTEEGEASLETPVDVGPEDVGAPEVSPEVGGSTVEPWSRVACSADADCLERAPFLRCLPGADNARWCTMPCATSTDCPANAYCQVMDPERTQGRCLLREPLCSACTSDASCGQQGRCVALEGNAGERHCLQRCEGSDLCTPGFVCDSGVCQPRAGVCGSCFDADGDGFGEGPGCAGPDCDDNDPQVHPGAEERCDDRDWSCSGNPLDGLLGTEEHCAYCGDACPEATGGVASWVCAASGTEAPAACEAICSAGFGTCGTLGGACEVDLQTDPFHCGACFHRCDARDRPGASRSVCIDGQCEDTLCVYGWARCGTSLACDTALDSDTDCGTCGTPCQSRPGELATCDVGRCTVVPDCGVDTDCDGRCTRLASDPEHCGACGAMCEPRVILAGERPLGGFQAQTCQQGECRCHFAGAGVRPPMGSPASCTLLDDGCSGVVDAGCPRYAEGSLRVHQLAAQDALAVLADEGHAFAASSPPEAWGPGAPSPSGAGLAIQRWLIAERQRALVCPNGGWVEALRVWRHVDHGVVQIAMRCARHGVGVETAPEVGRALPLVARVLDEEPTWRSEGASWVHPAEPVEERTLGCPEGHTVTGLEAALFSYDGVADVRIACQQVTLTYTGEADRPWRLLWSALAWQPWSALETPDTPAHLRVRGYGNMVLRGLNLGVRDGAWEAGVDRSRRGRVLYVGALGIQAPHAPARIPQEGTW